MNSQLLGFLEKMTVAIMTAAAIDEADILRQEFSDGAFGYAELIKRQAAILARCMEKEFKP